jgi:replicative DNA helicase
VSVPDAREPRHDIRAEMALLGACLTSRDALDTAIEAVTPADFYRPANAALFTAMIEMRDAGLEVDSITLAQHLGNRLRKLGTATYLIDCQQAVPTAANVGFYAEIIHDAAGARRLLALSQRAAQLAYNVESDPTAAIDRVRTEIDEVAGTLGSGTAGVVRIDALTDAAITRYASEAPPSLPTGWPDIDRLLSGGLRPETLTVIGGRPGTGKSMVAGCLGMNVASAGRGVLLASLEMTAAEVTDRVISNMAHVDLTRLVAQTLTEWDRRSVASARERLEAVPLHIVDDQSLTLSGIRSKARALHRDGDLAMLIIDYLALVIPSDPRQDRQLQVAAISRGLKVMSRELGIPVVAAHQLNRASARRSDPRPVLTDLRESGGIEQDADGVWLLDRPDPAKDEDADPAELVVHVAKNRQGPTGVVGLHWHPVQARVGSQTRFQVVK